MGGSRSCFFSLVTWMDASQSRARPKAHVFWNRHGVCLPTTPAVCSMGNVYSFSQPPPGAAIVEIESRECNSACQARTWDDRKPPQASAWSSSQWSAFSQEMSNHVRRFNRDGMAMLALLLIPIGILVLVIGLGQRSDGFSIMNIIHVPFILVAVLTTFIGSSQMRNANQAVDRDIEALCRRYSDGSVTLQYAYPTPHPLPLPLPATLALLVGLAAHRHRHRHAAALGPLATQCLQHSATLRACAWFTRAVPVYACRARAGTRPSSPRLASPRARVRTAPCTSPRGQEEEEEEGCSRWRPARCRV